LRLYSNKPTKRGNENYGKQPCTAKNLRPFQKQPYAVGQACAAETQRRYNTSLTNGPTFAVPVMLRIGAAIDFSATKCTAQPLGQGTRNEAKTRPGNYSRPNHQSRGNVA